MQIPGVTPRCRVAPQPGKCLQNAPKFTPGGVWAESGRVLGAGEPAAVRPKRDLVILGSQGPRPSLLPGCWASPVQGEGAFGVDPSARGLRIPVSTLGLVRSVGAPPAPLGGNGTVPTAPAPHWCWRGWSNGELGRGWGWSLARCPEKVGNARGGGKLGTAEAELSLGRQGSVHFPTLSFGVSPTLP